MDTDRGLFVRFHKKHIDAFIRNWNNSFYAGVSLYIISGTNTYEFITDKQNMDKLINVFYAKSWCIQLRHSGQHYGEVYEASNETKKRLYKRIDKEVLK